MKTNTKSIPDNAVCESTGNSAIPDAINMDNIEVIRRGAMELNHRARLGMAIVTPSGMKAALDSFGDDVARLCCRGSGLRVVNAGGRDPVAEQAALERQRQVEHEEKGKQIVKQLSESLAAFAECLEKAIAKQKAGTKNTPSTASFAAQGKESQYDRRHGRQQTDDQGRQARRQEVLRQAVGIRRAGHDS